MSQIEQSINELRDYAMKLLWFYENMKEVAVILLPEGNEQISEDIALLQQDTAAYIYDTESCLKDDASSDVLEKKLILLEYDAKSYLGAFLTKFPESQRAVVETLIKKDNKGCAVMA